MGGAGTGFAPGVLARASRRLRYSARTPATMDVPNLQRNVPLAPFNTYPIGRPADFYVTVHAKDEFENAIAQHAGMLWFPLSTGANILIGDGGIRAPVIHDRAMRRRLCGDHVTVESGSTVAELIEMTAAAGRSGLEHFAGIPSSVGGAIWQNLHLLAPDQQRTLFRATGNR